MSLPRSPQPFLRPKSPHRSRSSSPTMHATPGGRRWRALGSSEEVNLRNLSPSATLHAFTEGPHVFDTAREEYKIYACIENLTAAERELGARVAKAADRLESWCQEIQQWAWSDSFEPPPQEYQEERRRSIALHVQEHTKGTAIVNDIAPLEYYGSLLSNEVESHEARLNEIAEELDGLEFGDLKEHILSIHGPRSRPNSAGIGASQLNYKPLDDFSFLITQTLITSLPYHFQLKERLDTWTARITVLREVPGYLRELQTAQKAMNLGWDAIEPPNDASDAAFGQWKVAVNTISDVLQDKVRDLGQRLDRMLDSLEDRRDRLPDDWIDIFEAVESDLQRWTSDSRRKMIEFDVWRKQSPVQTMAAKGKEVVEVRSAHSSDGTPRSTPELAKAEATPYVRNTNSTDDMEARPRSVTAFKAGVPVTCDHPLSLPTNSVEQYGPPESANLTDDESDFEEGDTVVHNPMEEPEENFSSSFTSSFTTSFQYHSPSFSSSVIVADEQDENTPEFPVGPRTPTSRRGSGASISSLASYMSSPSVIEDSPSVRKTASRQSKTPRPELNAMIGKRRGPLKVLQDSEVESAVPWPPTKFSRQLTPNIAQDLDSKISDILTTIPAHIRLTSREEAEGKKPVRGNLSKQNSRGYLRSTRSSSGMKSPELTLSPAKDSASTNQAGRRSTAANRVDNDIKLYHLNQPGREKPIRLFIRRVGEQGERVMVRVGGGWADLGEYLRQYAEHHGRRATSEGKFEILGLEAKNVENSERERPESAMSKRSRRASGSTTGRLSTTPQKAVGLGILRDDAPPPPMPNFSGTPLVGTPIEGAPLTGTPFGAVIDALAPSTDSTHRSWAGNEVGLAGPKAKKLDLDGSKLEWIEGMMKQARSVSNSNLTTTWNPKMDHLPTPPASQNREAASSRPESRNGMKKGGNSRPQSRNGPALMPGGGARKQPSFGDLGKVGGTKRVFMRGGTLSEK